MRKKKFSRSKKILPNIKCNFDAQEFLDSLDLRFLLCKICPRANLKKGHGGIKGICMDFVKQNNCRSKRLLPINKDCVMHDIYKQIEEAACKLDGVLFAIKYYSEEGVDRVLRELKNNEVSRCLTSKKYRNLN